MASQLFATQSTPSCDSNAPHLSPSFSRHLILIAVLAALAGLCCIQWVDIWLAGFCRAESVPGELRTIFRLAEAFSHGYGAGVILIGVAAIGRVRWRGVLCLIGFTYIPGMIVNLFKVTVDRRRPNSFVEELPDQAWATFEGLFGMIGEGELFNRSWQSFPSGHTATAVGLAIGLTILFRRGYVYFAVLAVLAAWQRIDTGAHFPSDTLLGVTVACVWGSIQARWLARHDSWLPSLNTSSTLVEDPDIGLPAENGAEPSSPAHSTSGQVTRADAAA